MEMNDGRAPAAKRFAGQVKLHDVGSNRQERVNRRAQGADAFAVDDADAQYMPLAAGVQVVVDHSFRVAGTKGVEVKDSVNREIQRLLVRLEWV
jgi:hypothetical protein